MVRQLLGDRPVARSNRYRVAEELWFGARIQELVADVNLEGGHTHDIWQAATSVLSCMETVSARKRSDGRLRTGSPT
jgi:hypothetical protein